MSILIQTGLGGMRSYQSPDLVRLDLQFLPIRAQAQDDLILSRPPVTQLQVVLPSCSTSLATKLSGMLLSYSLSRPCFHRNHCNRIRDSFSRLIMLHDSRYTAIYEDINNVFRNGNSPSQRPLEECVFTASQLKHWPIRLPVQYHCLQSCDWRDVMHVRGAQIRSET